MTAKARFNKQRGTWCLYVHEGGGRTYQTFGPTEADRLAAETAALKHNADLLARQSDRAQLAAGQPVIGAPALRAWWEAAQRGYGEHNRANMERLIDDHLVPFFGKLDLRRLTKADVTSFGGAMAEKPNRQRPGQNLGQASVRNSLAILSNVLHWLEEQAELEFRIPVRGIIALGTKAAAAQGAESRAREAWTWAEAQELLALAPPALRPLLFTALHSGMRKGELLALEWADVDFSRGQLLIRRNLTRFAKKKPTKSGRIRRVEMSRDLQELLRGLAADRFKAAALGSALPPERVFLDRGGEPWKYMSLGTAWHRLIRRAHGLRQVRPLPFHSWRHTYVSLAMDAGVNPVWIAAQIGDRIETMLRHYAHLIPGQNAHTESFLSPRAHAASLHGGAAHDAEAPSSSGPVAAAAAGSGAPRS
jgi:integrase